MPSGPVPVLLEVETDQVPKVVGEIAPPALLVANAWLRSPGREVKAEVPGKSPCARHHSTR